MPTECQPQAPTTSAETIQKPESRVPWRVALWTLFFFALAVAARDIFLAVPAYREFYRSLPELLRFLEDPIRTVIICFAALYAVHRLTPAAAFRELGMAAPLGQALLVTFLAASPMLIGGAISGRIHPEFTLRAALFGAAIWPLTEEILYRGYAFRQLHRRANMGFWSAAILVGVVFGAVHLTQASVRALPLSGEIGVVALISIGGILFAWLLVKWDDNLWVPFGMHAFMNLWWYVFDMDDSPLGGWFANAMRLLTVVLAILLTIYRAKIPFLARTQPPE